MSDALLDHADFCRGVITILVNRLGASPVVITQDELDAIKGSCLREVSDGLAGTVTLDVTPSPRIN